jgi:peptide/nickel transport system substrate-binding protein
MRFRNIVTAVMTPLLVATLALSLAPSASAQQRGGKLVYMVPASGVPSLDAHKETTFATVQPTAPFYSLLIRLDPDDANGVKIGPDLATSWDVSADAKKYTFHMRSGVKFHDGSPLTSKDVKASYDKIIFPPEGVLSPRKAFFLMVDSIETPNDTTIVFNLKFPSAAFLPAMAMPYNYIYPASKLAEDIHWFEQNVLGSGPFEFVSFTPGSNIVGKRNPNFYLEGRPFLDGFEAVFSSKQNVYVQAIRGGRAHSMFRGLPPAAVDDLKRAMGDKFHLQEDTWNCALYVVPNSHKKPFDDPRVRRALNLAIDRWGGSKYLSRIAIVKTVGGVVFPGATDVAPTQAQLESLEGYGRDVEANRAKARQLLKEAGVPEGFKFVLHNRGTDQPYKIVGTWLIDQWRQIGLEVEQWVQPTAAFYDTLRSNPPGYEVSMDFNCQSIVNPTLDVSKFLSYDVGPANNGKYIDRELDRLYEEQLREPDAKKQQEILWKFQKRINDEQGWYFTTLWWQRAIVSNADMRAWNVTPSHYLNMQLDNVWLANQ